MLIDNKGYEEKWRWCSVRCLGVILNRAFPGCLLEKGTGEQRLAGRWEQAMWSTVRGGSGQWGQTAARRVGIYSSQVRSQVQLLSWQGGGARTPQHQCLDEINFLKNQHTTKTPFSHLCPDMAIWKCPLGTARKALLRWSLHSGIVQGVYKFRLDREAVHCRKQWQLTEQQWRLRRSQSRLVLMPQKPPINQSPRGWFISSLSWLSAPRITNTAQKPTRNPTALGYRGCAKAPLGARVGSRCVGHKVRQSFCCQPSRVWGPDTL